MGLQNFQRSVDLKFGARRGNVDENAASPPRAIDAHEIDGIPVFEANAFCFSTSPGHQDALAAAKSLSVKPGFANSRTDPNRIVRCATDRERESNNSLPFSSSCCEGPGVRPLLMTANV